MAHNSEFVRFYVLLNVADQTISQMVKIDPTTLRILTD